MSQPLYFVHISDTHIGPRPDHVQHGAYPYHCTRRAVHHINALPATPDFVIHTGDVTDNPDQKASALAAGLFNRLQPPIYYVTGNHDTSPLIRRWLPMPAHEALDEDPERLFYRFFVKGVECLVLDARGPEALAPQGLLPQDQLAYLQSLAGAKEPPLLVFLHYPLLPMDSPWFDQNMLVINGLEVHRALRAIPRLRAVFHGHVHQAMQTWRDGVLYASAASLFSNFIAWPGKEELTRDEARDPSYQFVQLLSDQLIIHQLTFPRPAPPQEEGG